MKKAIVLILVVFAIIVFIFYMGVTAYNQTEGVRSEKYLHR